MSSIYLDHSATSPLHPAVEEAMMRYGRERFGNPSSPHQLGTDAAKTIRDCRRLCRDLLAAPDSQIVFTSGGTEANNLALQGFARLQQPGEIVLSAVEHPSVSETARSLQNAGWKITALPVQTDGTTAVTALQAALSRQTRLVSIMWVNNEIGSIMPIAELAAATAAYNQQERKNIQFHVDAVQAPGRIPLSLRSLPVDMLSLSGHKIGGPKGSGLLWLRRGLQLAPLLCGGGQEGGLRSGTENVAGIVGLTKALQLAAAEQPAAAAHCSKLRDQLWQALKGIPGIYRTSPPDGAGHILHVCIPGIPGEVLVRSLDARGIAAATGSACSSKKGESPVLKALGLSPKLRRGALRFSFAAETSEEDIRRAGAAVTAAVGELAGAYS